MIACVAAQNGSLLRRQSGILFNEENERGGETFMTRKICRAVVAPSTRRAIGHAELVGIEGATAYLRLGGGCQGCGMATVTLSQGIEVAITNAVPEIDAIVDVTDHASGRNPYFEPAKK